MSSKNKDDEISLVDGSPAKQFFVNMLTRDIELQDAIMDLLDNCLDGILRTEDPDETAKKPYEGYWAKIEFDGTRFQIEDNCGGIPWELARDVAFRMGAADPGRPENSIGAVGIGMKRAMFKMGQYSIVHSHHRNNSFEVIIPRSWFSVKDDWSFEARTEKPQSKGFGTIIETRHLYEGISRQFDGGKTSDFHRRLLHAINTHYCYMIDRGFTIRVNGIPATAKPVELLCDLGKEKEAFRPYVYQSKIGPVSIFIAVGYMQQNPNEQEQEAAVEGHYSTENSGWTIVCNDRVVVASDKTRLTGWGDAGVPAHHPQFNGVRGIVELRSKKSSDLPVTTTKRGIDAGSNLYLLIRERMQFATKRFTSNTNKWKEHEGEQKRLLRNTEPLGLIDLKSEAKAGRVIKLTQIPGHDGQKQFVPDLPTWEEPRLHKTITFTRLIKDIEKVSIHLFGDVRSASEVGSTCFDRTLKDAKK